MSRRAAPRICKDTDLTDLTSLTLAEARDAPASAREFRAVEI